MAKRILFGLLILVLLFPILKVSAQEDEWTEEIWIEGVGWIPAEDAWMYEEESSEGEEWVEEDEWVEEVWIEGVGWVPAEDAWMYEEEGSEGEEWVEEVWIEGMGWVPAEDAWLY